MPPHRHSPRRCPRTVRGPRCVGTPCAPSVDAHGGTLDAVGAGGISFDIGTADDHAPVATQCDRGLAAFQHDLVLTDYADTLAIHVCFHDLGRWSGSLNGHRLEEPDHERLTCSIE